MSTFVLLIKLGALIQRTLDLSLVIIRSSFLWGVLAFGSVACSTFNPAPACVRPPGMLDRPCSPEQVIQPFYREDLPEAIGATGKPQLLIFYAPLRANDGCNDCERIRPMLQQLEQEYWERIDFVYLNMENDDMPPILEAYNITQLKAHLFFLAPDGKIIRQFRSGIPLGQEPKERDIRYTVEKYLKEQ